MKPAAILIIHYHNSPDTLACLDSLVKLKSKHPYKVYILSMQSCVDSKISKHPVKPLVITENDNLGFAGANNVLLKQAINDGCEYMVLLNNDTTVDPVFLDPLLERLQDSQVGMVSSKIYFYPGHEYHRGYAKKDLGKVIWYAGGVIDWNHIVGFHWGVDEVDHGQFSQSLETGFATGCSLAVSAKTIKKIGLIPEKYFLYYEDTDWSIRARQKNLKIIMEPASIVWHKNAGSTGGAGSGLHQHYQTRNRYIFGLTYAPMRVKIHLLLQLLKNPRLAIEVFRLLM